MVDIATISAAIGAATSAVGLFDKMADQIERFITKSPKPDVPRQHRMQISGSDGGIVVKEHGQTTQTITAQDLASLDESLLRHV